MDAGRRDEAGVRQWAHVQVLIEGAWTDVDMCVNTVIKGLLRWETLWRSQQENDAREFERCIGFFELSKVTNCVPAEAKSIYRDRKV